MKIMILVQLLVGLIDYDSTKIMIEANIPVEHCELYYIENDKLYQVENPVFEGSKITLYLKQYRDYELIVNYHTVVSLTLLSEEIRDDRDIDISSDVSYTIHKDVITFEKPDLTFK